MGKEFYTFTEASNRMIRARGTAVKCKSPHSHPTGGLAGGPKTRSKHVEAGIFSLSRCYMHIGGFKSTKAMETCCNNACMHRSV